MQWSVDVENDSAAVEIERFQDKTYADVDVFLVELLRHQGNNASARTGLRAGIGCALGCGRSKMFQDGAWCIVGNLQISRMPKNRYWRVERVSAKILVMSLRTGVPVLFRQSICR